MTERKYTGNPEISRRAALRGIGLIAAVSGGIMGVAAANEDQSPSVIARLIGAHRVAETSYIAACNAYSEAYDLAKTELPQIRVIMARDAFSKEPTYGFTEPQVRKYMARWKINSFTSAQNAVVDDRIEARCAELKALRDEHNRIYCAHGLDAMEKETDRLSEIESTAFLALIAEPVKTAADASMKAAYFVSIFDENKDRIDEDHLVDVLRSMIAEVQS